MTRKSYVFLICVAISSIIWLLIALSKNYTTYVDFPVTYSNLPEDQLIVNKLPNHLSLEISAGGFQLLGYKWFGTARTLDIDVSKYNLKEEGNRSVGFIVTASLFDQLSRQFRKATLRREYISPDTIHLVTSDTTTRRLRVRPVIAAQFEDGFRLAGAIDVYPATVDVFGPACLLDTMSTINTKPLSFQEVEEDLSIKSSLDFGVNAHVLSCKEPSVLISVPVDRFTMGSVEVPVRVEGSADSVEILALPERITVEYMVGMKNFEKVNASMFNAVASFPAGVQPDSVETLKVKLERQPDDIEVTRYTPKKISFKWRRK